MSGVDPSQSSNLHLGASSEMTETQEYVVVTPPASGRELPDLLSEFDLSSQSRSMEFSYANVSGEELLSDVPLSVKRKSNSMPASRSYSSLPLPSPEKSFLQLPKRVTRSFSARKNVDDEKPRSRTPEPTKRILERTRSSSPHSPKFPFKTNALNFGDESPWSKTVKFLARKTTSSPSTVSVPRQFRESSSPWNISESSETCDALALPLSADQACMNEGNAAETSTLPGGASSGLTSSAMPRDAVDGPMLPQDSQRDHLRQKIAKISEQIKIELATRDDNVAEYLRLANNADKQQTARVKSVFEKKNQKSKANVNQLQKKLEGYQRRLKDLESNGKTLQGPKDKLKEVQARLSEGVANSVPGMFFNKVVSGNKKMGGSMDNISAMKDDDRSLDNPDLERCNSVGSVSAATSDSGEADFPHSQRNSVSSQPTRGMSPQPQLSEIRSQISALNDKVDRIKDLEEKQYALKLEIDGLKVLIQNQIVSMNQNLEQTNYRFASIESQQRDLNEIHRREMSDVRQAIDSVVEKCEYLVQERARDMQEIVESCQTRITKMEVQQQHQHQQLVTMEGVENASAKALAGKLINLLLSVLAVILVFVSTASSLLMPFVRNQTRVVVSGVCVILAAALYRNWTSWTLFFSELWTR